MLVKMRISEGGYRYALTPISTPILKIDMMRTMGPYTMKDIFSPPAKLKTDLMVA